MFHLSGTTFSFCNGLVEDFDGKDMELEASILLTREEYLKYPLFQKCSRFDDVYDGLSRDSNRIKSNEYKRVTLINNPSKSDIKCDTLFTINDDIVNWLAFDRKVNPRIFIKNNNQELEQMFNSLKSLYGVLLRFEYVKFHRFEQRFQKTETTFKNWQNERSDKSFHLASKDLLWI